MGVAAAPESFIGSRRPEQVRDCDAGLPSLRLASPHKCLPGFPVAKRGQVRDRVRNRAREVSHLDGQLGADEDDVRLLTVPAIRDGRASTRKRVSNVGKQAQYRRGATAAELVWPAVLQYTPSVRILLVGATYRLGSTVLQASGHKQHVLRQQCPPGAGYPSWRTSDRIFRHGIDAGARFCIDWAKWRERSDPIGSVVVDGEY